MGALKRMSMMLNNAALVLGARMDVDGNLNFLAETVEDRHQTVDGEAAEAALPRQIFPASAVPAVI